MLAMMDQLTSGLMLFGVLEQIKIHREVMATMLTIEAAAHFQLTADKILDNIIVDGSPEGSNKKLEEINIHKFYCDYVQDVETREGTNFNYLMNLPNNVLLQLVRYDTKILLKFINELLAENPLSKLYRFITGSNTITPLGAEVHIKLQFKHGCPANCRCRPTVSTCDPSIMFPVHYSDSKDFEKALDDALDEYYGFGLV